MIQITEKNKILQTLTGSAMNISIASSSYIGLGTGYVEENLYNQSGERLPTGLYLLEEPNDPEYMRTTLGNYQNIPGHSLKIEDGVCSNKLPIMFTDATVDWGTITHFGLFSSLDAKYPYLIGELTAPITINTGYMAIFKPGNFTISIN